MFESENLIYIRLQKTGCSHIADILEQIFEGERHGTHRAANERQLNSGKYFISSIRNPWDWYISLWAYGVQDGGSLKNTVTRRKISAYLRYALKHPRRETFQRFIDEIGRDVDVWNQVYTQSDDVDAFRRWLKLMLDPANAQFLNKHYAASRLGRVCGFMSFRYLYLCCRDVSQLGKDRLLTDFPALTRFDRDNCYINYFIHQESLEEGLAAALEGLGPLSEGDRELIFKGERTNSSKRGRQMADYYDDETIALVAERDRLLIDKFGYSPPT